MNHRRTNGVGLSGQTPLLNIYIGSLQKRFIARQKLPGGGPDKKRLMVRIVSSNPAWAAPTKLIGRLSRTR
jgi:hypothetical protein